MPALDFPFPDFEINIAIELILGAALLGLGGFLVLFWVRRRFKHRKLVRNLEKRRPKPYHGDEVLKYTKKHRKTGSNTHKSLRAKGKKRFARYIGFKRRELRIVLLHIDKKGFGKPKSKPAIRILKDKKEIKRIKWPYTLKKIIKTVDSHACLDECILYLDSLPRQIADKKPFSYKPKTLGITFDYELE